MSRFDPHEAAASTEGLTVHVHPVADVMGGGIYLRRGDRAHIVLAPHLDDATRRVVLTHELVHHERSTTGVGIPNGCEARLLELEERVAHRETARRLVPPADLRRAIAELLASEGSVTVAAVAERFAVTAAVARRALDQLGGDAAPREATGTWSRKAVSAFHQASGASNCGL